MDLPELVASALGADESVLSRVPLGGEDALFVTDRRSLVYRSEGLLSDESIEEYGHDAERVAVSEGRRKSEIVLDYGLDGEETLTVPADRLETALQFLMTGVLDAAGVIDPDEEVTHVFRFSELSLVIASKRLVKHIGSPVWDEDAEQFRYADVTDLNFEEGSVATSVVLTLNGRRERFKAPNEQARAVREGLESALLSYHDVESIEELRVEKAAEEENAETEAEAGAQTAAGADDPFGDGLDPLGGAESEAAAADDDRGENATAQAESGFEGSGFEAAGTVDNGDLAEEVASLREAVERQNEQLQKQQQTIERLIEELRRGR